MSKQVIGKQKQQFLYFFADDFSRAELQEISPGLSKWRIDQARQNATEAREGQPPPETPSFRKRKVDYFNEYISRPEFVQDVAFGVQAWVGREEYHAISSRIIKQYLDTYKENEFEPASQRSLHRMTEVCQASMQ